MDLLSQMGEESFYVETVEENPFLPLERPKATMKQRVFATSSEREVLFGGAAGGGKTIGLCILALQFVEVAGYNALLLRRTMKMMERPDSPLSVLHDWLMTRYDGRAGKVKYLKGEDKFVFPSGSVVQMGAIEHEEDKRNYDGTAWHFIGFDELTHFSDTSYVYMFGRQRRRRTGREARLPLRMRATAMPGGEGHAWVRERFILPYQLGKMPRERAFIPSKLTDNSFLDQKEYRNSLAIMREVDYVTAQRMEQGDWEIYEGGRFRREWFEKTFRFGARGHLMADGDEIPESHLDTVVICDPAASEKDMSDYTVVGVFSVETRGLRRLFIREIVRERLAIDRIVPVIAAVCRRWRPSWCGIEGNGYQWAIVDAAMRDSDIPAVVPLLPEGKGKLVRATPAINYACSGRIFLPADPEPWMGPAMQEIWQFTGDSKHDGHDDVVDVLAYMVQEINRTMRMFNEEIPIGPDLPRRKWSDPDLRDAQQRRRALFGQRSVVADW